MPLPRKPRLAGAGALVLLAIWMAGGASGDADLWVERLRNDEVRWDGTWAGLVPHTEGRNGKSLLELGERAIPALVAALDDPEKFAAAHVLLTLIRKRPYSTSGSHWNRLRVSIRSDGAADLHPEQIPEIKAFWETTLGGAS